MPKSRKVSFPDTSQIDEITGKPKIIYKLVGDLPWYSSADLQRYGIEDLPNDKPLRLFQLTAKHRVEYIVTNDVSVETAKAAKSVGGFRWKDEQFHREVKPLTGVAKAKPGKDGNKETISALSLWCGTSSIFPVAP